MAATTIDQIPVNTMINMTPVKLDSSTYLIWNRQMTHMAECFDIQGFLDDTDIAPSETVLSDAGVATPNPAYLAWRMKDRKLLSVIWTSLSQEAMSEVLDCTSSHSAWTTLQAAFSDSSASRTHQLPEELTPVFEKEELRRSEISLEEEWADKKKSGAMIVASLIASMTFVALVTPPGGVWQENSPEKSVKKHKAGYSVLAPGMDNGFVEFLIFNTIALVASLSILMFFVSGVPLRRRILMRFLMWVFTVLSWVAIISIALAYIQLILMLLPDGEMPPIIIMLKSFVVGWVVLMTLMLAGHTAIRFAVIIFKKAKTWLSWTSSETNNNIVYMV